MSGAQERSEGRIAARAEIAGRRVAWVARGGAGCAEAALGALRARIEADPASLGAAAAGGAALALVPFEECATEGGPPEPMLAVSVGDAVVRGVPTAARATVTGRAPERPGVTEAQVGGGFARAMAAAGLDVLVVSGGGPAARIRLVPDAPPVVESVDGPLEAPPRALRGPRTIPERAAALVAEGECALLVGPGADLGLSFANIASVDGPRDRAPSFVGRGGLGAAFARAGVVAIVAEGEAAAPDPADAALLALLRRSPRLAARAAEGTLELGAHRAARDLAEEARGRPRERHGCRGCPTPCGWVFDLPGGRAVGGRFSALRAALGGDDAMAFVERCNALGVDAVAAAEVLGGAPPEDLLDAGSPARQRAAERAAAPRPADLDVAVPGDLAAAVGVAVSARGPEPLRSLSVFGLDPSSARAIVTPLPWTDGADAAADAGTLARWHECFAAALDVVGFCAFSGAGLLADGVATPGELAARLAPVRGARPGWSLRGVGAGEGQDPAADMLAAGAEHLARHARLGGGHDAQGRAAGRADGPGGEALARAIEAYGRAASVPFLPAPLPGASGRGGADPAGPGPDAGGEPRDPDRTRGTSAPSGASDLPRVRLRASGFLAERIAGHGERELLVEVAAATPADAVRALAASRPGSARWLLGPDGRVLPAALVGGAPTGPAAALRDGDLVELVLLIPGG